MKKRGQFTLNFFLAPGTVAYKLFLDTENYIKALQQKRGAKNSSVEFFTR